MKRYHYSDPLAAAWMAKHFGMKLQYAEYALGDLTSPLNFVDFDQGYDDKGYFDLDVDDPYPKYFIHPNSLHLLKPIIGDFYMDSFGHGYRYNSEEDHDKVEQIIQRDGKPFFWPEEEL